MADGAVLLAGCLVEFGKRLRLRHWPARAAVLGSGFRSGLGRRVERLLQLGDRPPRPERRLATALLRAAGPVVLICFVLFAAAWARPLPAEQGAPSMAAIRSSWRSSIAHAFLAAAVSLAPSPARALDLREQAQGLRRQAADVMAQAGQTADPASRARLLRDMHQSLRDADQSETDAGMSQQWAKQADARAAEVEQQAALLEQSAPSGQAPATAPAGRESKRADAGPVRQASVFRLKYARAESVAEIVEKAIASWRKAAPGVLPVVMVPDKRTNSLIVSGPPEMVRRVAELVMRLDAPPGTQPAAEGVPKYAADLAAFFAEVDGTYPFLDLKGVRGDWEATKKRLWEKLKTCRSDTEFLGLVIDAIRCLRDGHMFLEEPKAKLPSPPERYCPGISFLPAADSRVIVMYPPQGHEKTLKTGTIVTEIDGRDARQVLEERAKQAWAAGGFFSSPQRARLFEYRIALEGTKGQKHTLTYLAGKTKRQVVLTCDVQARGWPHSYNLPSGLKRVGRSFWHTKLPSGAGYTYIRRVDDSTEAGLAEALKTHRDAKGWIVDLRGNGGGGYSGTLVEAIEKMPRPVAVLIDAGCVSAGETLARDFARGAEARLLGSKTAGCSSSKRLWKFPSGIASMRISVRSRWRNDRQPIEFNGIDPDELVEAVPEEAAQGLNSAILRAERYLKGKLATK